MLRERPGINPRGVTVAQIWIPWPNNPDANPYLNPPQRARLARELVQRLEAAPGVQSVAVGLTTSVPFLSTRALNSFNLIAFSFPGNATSAQEEYTADFGAVSPNYFDLLKLPLRKGRVFTDHDDYGATNVVVVNEAFVRKFFPQQNPIGQRVRDKDRTITDSEIIGVVGDVLDHGLDQPPEPRLYGSILQRSNQLFAVFLRTSANLTTTRQLVTRTMEQIDPEVR